MDFNVYITLPPTMILRCDVATRGSNIPELNKYLCEMYEGVVISLRIERGRERKRKRDMKKLCRPIIYVSPKVNTNTPTK